MKSARFTSSGRKFGDMGTDDVKCLKLLEHVRYAVDRGISKYGQPFVVISPNVVWAYDFVFDGCTNGQKLMCLTLIDEFTKESLYIDVAGSIVSQRVVQILEQVIADPGYPKVLRSDTGPEFISTILLESAVERGPDNLHI